MTYVQKYVAISVTGMQIFALGINLAFRVVGNRRAVFKIYLSEIYAA